MQLVAGGGHVDGGRRREGFGDRGGSSGTRSGGGRRSVSELNGGLFHRLGGVVAECFEDGAGPGSVAGMQHGIEGFEEGSVPEIRLSAVAVDPVEEGRDFDELVAGVEEVEVEDVVLARHGRKVSRECTGWNAECAESAEKRAAEICLSRHGDFHAEAGRGESGVWPQHPPP